MQHHNIKGNNWIHVRGDYALGAAWFESRMGHQLTWLRNKMIFLPSVGKFRNIATIGHGFFKFTLPFDAKYFRSPTVSLNKYDLIKTMKCNSSCAGVLNSCVEYHTADRYSSHSLSGFSMSPVYCFRYPHSVFDINYYVIVCLVGQNSNRLATLTVYWHTVHVCSVSTFLSSYFHQIQYS